MLIEGFLNILVTHGRKRLYTVLWHGQALSGRIVLAALSLGIDAYVEKRMAVILVIGKAYLLKGVLVDAVHTYFGSD